MCSSDLFPSHDIGRTGWIEYTDDDDVLLSTSLLYITGAVEYTEEGDTLIGTGELHITGTTGYTEENDVLSARAGLLIQAWINYAEQNDSLESYILALPWGGTVGNSGRPYTLNEGENPNGLFSSTSGNYDNRKPYEEN